MSLKLTLLGAVLFVLVVASVGTASPSSALFGGAQERVKVSFLADATEAGSDFYGDPSKIVPMSLPNGSRYHCRLPGRAASQEDDDRMWRRHLQRVRDHPLPAHLASRINSALRDQCFTQPAGWWTYKLCWRDSLKQLHLDAAGKPEAEYILGQGPLKHIEDGADDELLFDVDPFDPTRARLLTEFFNGTVCDLTKEARQLQLLLYCADSKGPSSSSNKGGQQQQQGGAGAGGSMELTIVEPLSCQYQVTLKHPVFCSIPELRARRQPEVVVQCIELPGLEEGENQEEEEDANLGGSVVVPTESPEVQVEEEASSP